MYTTYTGYTESEAKVQARAERRAWLNEIALAEFWAAEQQRVNFEARTAYLEDVRTADERARDEFAMEVKQTRESDRPM